MVAVTAPRGRTGARVPTVSVGGAGGKAGQPTAPAVWVAVVVPHAEIVRSAATEMKALQPGGRRDMEFTAFAPAPVAGVSGSYDGEMGADVARRANRGVSVAISWFRWGQTWQTGAHSRAKP